MSHMALQPLKHHPFYSCSKRVVVFLNEVEVRTWVEHQSCFFLDVLQRAPSSAEALRSPSPDAQARSLSQVHNLLLILSSTVVGPRPRHRQVALSTGLGLHHREYGETDEEDAKFAEEILKQLYWRLGHELRLLPVVPTVSFRIRGSAIVRAPAHLAAKIIMVP